MLVELEISLIGVPGLQAFAWFCARFQSGSILSRSSILVTVFISKTNKICYNNSIVPNSLVPVKLNFR